MGAGASLLVGFVDVVHSPLSTGTWTCYSGRGSTTARGMRRRVKMPLSVGTLRCCSGRERTTTSGMSGRVAKAARHGHLEVLKWAVEHGNPWNAVERKQVCTRRRYRSGDEQRTRRQVCTTVLCSARGFCIV